MPTESKKLWTTLDKHGLLSTHAPDGHVWACAHDARIAHEQREVIRQQDAQISALVNWIDTNERNPAANHLLTMANETRAAAAPYIQED